LNLKIVAAPRRARFVARHINQVRLIEARLICGNYKHSPQTFDWLEKLTGFSQRQPKAGGV
jgi:hypothetical protein